MSKYKEIAQQVLNTASELGWRVDVRGDILQIRKPFEKGNNDAFCKADSEYYSILGLVPTTSPGSVWGTDGGGIGALSAINSGVFNMKKSGCSKNVLNWIRKLQ